MNGGPATPLDSPAALDALLVAVDGGAREALSPIAHALGLPLEDIGAAEVEGDIFWRDALAQRSARLLVVGTSDSPRARRVEAAARRAARSAGLPIVAIEDFPGNYFTAEGGEATLVLVESAAARELLLKRVVHDAQRVEVLSPTRYDVQRGRARELRAATQAAWAQQQAQRTMPRVLWAGQPETQDCLRTLEAVLPVLRAHGVELIFKAHPRDPGYTGGTYEALLDDHAIRYEDATPMTVPETLDRAPRLAITQFSSVPIEAGFYGIPGLCVLLPEAGGMRLFEKKGYAVPPFCTAGAVAYATSAGEITEIVGKALFDTTFRTNLNAAFDRYFEVQSPSLPRLLAFLLNAL